MSGSSETSREESRAPTSNRPRAADGVAWVRDGDALAEAGRAAEALAAYDEALRLEPDEPEVWARKGAVLARLGRRPEAVHWLYRAWTARSRLSDDGRAAAWLLTDLGIVLSDCDYCSKRDE